METKLYYFSGTGNSIYAARKFAEAIGDCELIPIPKALKSPEPIRGGRIGIIFPVIMYRLPYIVVRFLKKIENADFLFGIAATGGASGKAIPHMKSVLKKQGLKLNQGYCLHMPSNYIPFDDASSPEEEKALLADADKRVVEIAEMVKKGEPVFEKDTPLLKTYLWPGIFYRRGYGLIPELDKGFILEDSCTGCNICAHACPVDNIIMVDKKPTWHHQCEQCFACLHWCPTDSIQWTFRTKGKPRYRNPYVTLKDIIKQK